MFMRRFSLVLVVLTLFLLLVPACGGGGEEATPTFTGTPTATTTPAATQTPTPTPTPAKEPVKIGAIADWSGPAALSGIYYANPVIKTVEKQVNDMGGILGGRSVKVVKYDDRSSVADAAGGVTKLVLDDKVSALVFGGARNTEANAIADEAAKYKVLFVTLPPIDTVQNKYVIQATVPTRCIVDDTAKLVTDVLKPKTVALLGRNEEFDQKVTFPGWKKALEAAGINIVYAELTPVGVLDFTPYLTKIKYYDPDVLILEQGSEETVSIAKQIIELGGWGHTQVVAQSTALSAVKMAGTKGWLVMVLWYPGLDTPESVKFKEDFKAVNGKLPEINHVFYYFSLWAAIHAIELAGTAEDTEAIARAARSGNLEFDSLVGNVHYTPDGDSGINGRFIQMQGNGNIVGFKQ